MAPSEAAAPSRDNIQANSTPQTPKAPTAAKSLATRAFAFTIRAYFPTPAEPTRFNPVTAMNQLFNTMLKDEPSLVLCSLKNDNQVILATAPIPTGKKEFQKFCNVSTTRNETQNKTNVCIGCNLRSDRTLGSIKHRSTSNHLLAWIKKERIFVESDLLGTDRPRTVGYFTKIAPDITHLANLQEHLTNQLMLVEMDAETAVELAPHLKDQQLDAMTNGDDYIPILPNFQLYRTHLTHGSAPNQISTDVIGVKAAPQDAKLLSEFFTRLAAVTGNEQRDGTFLPTGAANLLGPQTYAQILQSNNFFLTNVATVPVNLEYAAWFAVIDPSITADDAVVSIHDHLIRQPWFLRIESVSRNKCLLVTTKTNLPAARAWLDEHLEPMVRKSIPPEIDPPASLLPRRLDKPVYTTTTQTYADILKKQFSLAPNSPETTTTSNKPPRKRQASLLDYDSDQSTEFASSPPVNHSATHNGTIANNSTTTTLPTPAFATELQSLKTELAQLKEVIATAVTQIKDAIAALLAPNCTNASYDTTIDTDQTMESASAAETLTPLDIQSFITDLKQEIATLFLETRAMIQQQSLTTPTTKRLPSKT